MNDLIGQLFVKDGERLMLNRSLELRLKDEQSAAQFLVAAIRHWHKERGFFCHDNTSETEEKWSFGYKTPSDCGGCVSGQQILDKIFGNRGKFNALPFVTYHGDRYYSFPFELLNFFAENGSTATGRLMAERQETETRAKAATQAELERQERAKQEQQLIERLGAQEISDELRVQLLPYATDQSLVIVNPRIAVKSGERSEYGSVGGIGYYDQVIIFCSSQRQTQEWQWRDRYSASRDRHDLRIDSLGQIEIVEQGGQTIITVEILNKRYNNRTATFCFDRSKTADTKQLSTEEQAAFSIAAECEMARVMAKLERLYELKPQMVGSGSQTGYVPYRPPRLKQRELCPEWGIAAFVTEEQIDHVASDPQLRHELFVLTAGMKQAERKAEDHGYERAEGGAFLSIIAIEPGQVIISTKAGKSTINL